MFSGGSPEQRRTAPKRGFTLVEILLVVAIMLILSAVSMPYLFKSIRGNRLRAAMTSVVQAGRYARSIAILSQREMILSFDLKNATLHVGPRYTSPAPTAPGTEEPPPSAAGQPAPAGEPETNGPSLTTSGSSFALTRKLDDVRIESVEVENQGKEPADTAVVIYRSNGRCTPYRVRLADEKGDAMVASVNALSGASVKREDR